MAAVKDLREFIALLERKGQLKRITAEVDPVLEIGALRQVHRPHATLSQQRPDLIGTEPLGQDRRRVEERTGHFRERGIQRRAASGVLLQQGEHFRGQVVVVAAGGFDERPPLGGGPGQGIVEQHLDPLPAFRVHGMCPFVGS